MRWQFLLGAIWFAVSTPALAEKPNDLEAGFIGALSGCEQWVLHPATWADGLDQFSEKLGLGERAGWVKSVNEAALPPESFRIANHYFRINSTDDSGYILVVSDRLPICHITGGGAQDLQPTVEAVLESEYFRSRWKEVTDNSSGEMVSSVYQSLEEPAFSVVISRARESGQRLDRVQVMATAQFVLNNEPPPN